MSTLSFLLGNARFLAFGLACTVVSNFGQTFFIALFGDDIRSQFSLSHGDFGALYGLATLCSAVIILWAGRLIDRVDLRWYAAVVFGGLALSSIMFSIADHIAILVLAFAGLRLFGQGLLRHTAVVSMARYFEATRGRAISVVGLGYPLGETVFPALILVLLAQFSWRDVWLGVGVYVLVLHLPLALWLLKGHGVRHAKLEKRLKAGGDEHTPLTQSQLLRDWRFLTIVPASLMGPFLMTGLFFHQLAIAGAKGWDVALLAASFPFFAGASVISNLITGWLVDRSGPGVVLPIFLLPLILALGVVGTLNQTWAAPLYHGLGGLSVGAGSVLISAAWAETFGVRHLGSIRSLTSALAVMSTALAPALMGSLLDTGVTVERIAFGAALIALATALCVLAPSAWLRRQKRERNIETFR